MNHFNLTLKNLSVSVNDKLILHKINLSLNSNEIHALIGPNGNGKSTLLLAMFNHPSYQIVSGDILLNGVSILNKTVDEKSKLGLFLAMQSPIEIPGIVNADFLRAFINSRQKKSIDLFNFYKLITSNLKKLKMSNDLITRYLNVDFSGGEKKKNEILQLLLLKPKLAMLDEIDSGLDVDALHVISDALINLQNESQTCYLIVSHYDNLFSLITPSHLHIMLNGRLATCNNLSIIKEIQAKGFDFLYKLYKIEKPKVKEVDEKVTPF